MTHLTKMAMTVHDLAYGYNQTDTVTGLADPNKEQYPTQ